MKNILVFLNLFMAFQLIMSCDSLEEKGNDVSSDQMTYPVDRGKYLVTIMDCNICHSPKIFNEKGFEFDKNRILSGFPSDAELPAYDSSHFIPGGWVLFHPEFTSVLGPWGISFSSNLTPHETGLGNWTFEQFKIAMTEGKHKGMENGRPLLPPMPWKSFQSLTDEDLQSIFAYLKSIPPVDNIVPEPVPPPKR